MNKPKRIDLSQQELDALIERVEAGTLLDSDREIIKAMADTISILSHAVDEKSASIKRLLKMIFGSSTEKTDAVLKNKDEEKSSTEKNNDRKKSEKPKGHGRNGASSYSGADKVKIQHDTLKPKDNCPKCLKGKLYEVKGPKTVVRVNKYAYAMKMIMEHVKSMALTHSSASNLGCRKHEQERYEGLVDSEFREPLMDYVRRFKNALDFDRRLWLKQKVAELNRRIMECQKIWGRFSPPDNWDT